MTDKDLEALGKMDPEEQQSLIDLDNKFQQIFAEIDAEPTWNCNNRGEQTPGLTELQKRLLKCLFLCNGLVTHAAEMCKCSRSTHTLAIRDNPRYKYFADQVKESILDMVESSLFQLVNKKNPFIITWYLEKQGRSRGYGKEDININLSNPITFKLDFDESKNDDTEARD
jgi:hypothetical protein